MKKSIFFRTTTINKICIIFVLFCFSAATTYSQDCHTYQQRAEEFMAQKKYCEAKKYYQMYGNCNADADVSTEIAMCERRCKLQVMENEETEIMDETAEVEELIERKEVLTQESINEKFNEKKEGLVEEKEVTVPESTNAKFNETKKFVEGKEDVIPKTTNEENSENVETIDIPVNEPTITSTPAQGDEVMKYRRSALSLILMVGDTSNIAELNTLKETQEILLKELQKNRGNIDQLAKEIDDLLWEKNDNINISTIKEIAKNSWNDYPFPDKYDDHNIFSNKINLLDVAIVLSNKDEKEIQNIERKINNNNVLIGNVEQKRFKQIQKISKKDKYPKNYVKDLKKIDKKYGGPLKTYRLQVDGWRDEIYNIKVGGTRSTIFTAMKDQKKDVKNLQPKLEKQFMEQRIAHQLVKQWFSSEDGKMFDMSLIQQRGFYNATELEYAIAKKTVRGSALLADAGEELINNTFVAVTDLNFFSNKPIADMLRAIGNSVNSNASNAGAVGQLVGAAAQLSTTIAAAAIQDGYTVFSKTFLYKLKWDETIAAKFYSIWGNEDAFNKMNFELEFVGVQYEKSKVDAGAFSSKENRKLETVVKKLVTRNLDENFANLQKEYDVFKPKVPIISVNPLTAYIGMKEGLKGGEKFEILVMSQDPETGSTKWERVGTTTVNKKYVWDNRYNVGDEPETVVIGQDGVPINATTFNNNPKAQPGMFLRQIK